MHDIASFKQEFFSEAQDHLNALNTHLLKLEKDPSNKEIINGIFRSAHTLKGNSNTMGFLKFGELAHSIEDILSGIREGKVAMTPQLMDALFSALDSLEDGLRVIEEDGNEHQFDSASVIKKLADIDPSKANQNENHSISEHMTLFDDDWDRINEAKEQKKNVYRVVGAFDSQCKIKFAKALLLLRELNGIGDILKCNPSQEDIKTGKLGSGVEFLIATEKKKEDTAGVLASLSGFDHIDLLTMESSYGKERIEKISHERKEHHKDQIFQKSKDDTTKQIQSVKISIERLDHLMNMVGELLINNMRIQNISRRIDSKELFEVVEGFNRLVAEIQEEVMSQRMIPIGQIFNRFPRMIRDISKAEKKKVNIIIEGEEIEFDRTVLDEIGEPLVHLLRNCVDHGIESPEERVKNGKPESGIIQLIASRRRNTAVIEIIDDGKGIDPEAVKRAAVGKGLISAEEAAMLQPQELQRLIFQPGLSTNKKVTEISGRGVGMDVVENKVRLLGGSVRLDSTVGQGTTVTLDLPLTLAIVSALLVKVGKETYAIQLNQVNRVVKIDSSDIRTIQGNRSFILVNQDIPLVDLREELGCGRRPDQKKLTVVIVENRQTWTGLIVDSIISQQQILIKPLDDLVKGTRGIAGAMILGGGDIGLILDTGAFT